MRKTARAEIVQNSNPAGTRFRARILEGEEEGIAYNLDMFNLLSMSHRIAVEVGRIVTVEYEPADQFASVVG